MKRSVAVQPPDCDMAIGCCDREEIAVTGVGFCAAAAPVEAATLTGEYSSDIQGYRF